MPAAFSDLVDRDGFQFGILLGIAMAAASVIIARFRPTSSAGFPFAGELLCIGTYTTAVAVDVPFPRPVALAGALAVLGLAGESRRLPRVWRPLGFGLFACGSVLLLPTLVVDDALAVALVVAVAVGSSLAAEFDPGDEARSLTPAISLITVVGVYAVVPDTDHAAIAVAVALPIAVSGWPLRAASLSASGGAAFVGLVGWLAGTGGAPRPGSVIAALACTGVLTLLPLLARVGAPFDTPRLRWGIHRPLALLVVHTLVVIMCSRVAGLEHSAYTSAAISLATLGAGALALAAIRVGVPEETSGEGETSRA